MGMRLIELLSDPIEYKTTEEGEGIAATLRIDTVVLSLLSGAKLHIVELATERPSNGFQIRCSCTDKSFIDSYSAVEFVAHAIEHRTALLAVKNALGEGHQNIIAAGETTSYSTGASIVVELSSDLNKGFGLKKHLSGAISEMEDVLKTKGFSLL